MDRISAELGTMALCYLLSTKHTVSFANQNADYIRRSFTTLFPPTRALYGDVAEEEIVCFARALACSAFGKQQGFEAPLAEERFRELCYVFVLSTFYSMGLTIGKKEIADLVRSMKQPHVRVQPFFKRITADLWRMLEQP